MKKIIQIDIGTHYGQELLSLFIPFYVFCKFLKLIINNSLRNKRSIPNSNFNAIKYLLPTLKSSYKIHRKRDNFILVGIEPNTLLFNSRVYKLLEHKLKNLLILRKYHLPYLIQTPLLGIKLINLY